MSVSLNQSDEARTEIMSLISHSFKANNDLMNCMDKMGIRMTDEEWCSILRNPQEASKLERKLIEEVEDNHWSKSICKDANQLNGLREVKERIRENAKSIASTRALIQEFEEDSTDERGKAYSHSELSLKISEYSMRIAEVEAHRQKLNSFEETHLNSNTIS